MNSNDVKAIATLLRQRIRSAASSQPSIKGVKATVRTKDAVDGSPPQLQLELREIPLDMPLFSPAFTRRVAYAPHPEVLELRPDDISRDVQDALIALRTLAEQYRDDLPQDLVIETFIRDSLIEAVIHRIRADASSPSSRPSRSPAAGMAPAA